MKPVTDTQDSGIVETTTRRRIIPASDTSSGAAPDLWDYLRAITPGDWPKHTIYGYRVEPSPAVPLFKCYEAKLKLPNGRTVDVADEQEMEFALMENFGGGVFRLMVKRGPQLVTRALVAINAPPRPITIPVDPSQPMSPGGGTLSPLNGADPTAAVANRAFDALTNQERQSAEIGFSAMRTAAEVMQRFGTGSNGDVNAQILRELMMELREQRRGMSMPEIFGLITSGIGILKELGVLGQNANPMIAQIMETGLKRLLEPPTTSGPPVSMVAEIVRQAPGLIQGFAEAIREQRMLAEAQARAMVPVRPAGAPSQVLPPALPNVPPQPAPQAAPVNGAPSMDFVERKIVEIFQRPMLSAEQAADEAMAFLDELDKGAVAQLATMGEQGLLEFFHRRPLLKPATNNPGRLVEFIRAFLKMHAEDLAEAGKEPPKPALPN